MRETELQIFLGVEPTEKFVKPNILQAERKNVGNQGYSLTLDTY